MVTGKWGPDKRSLDKRSKDKRSLDKSDPKKWYCGQKLANFELVLP